MELYRAEKIYNVLGHVLILYLDNMDYNYLLEDKSAAMAIVT